MLTAPLISLVLAASQAPAAQPPTPSPGSVAAGDVEVVVALPWTNSMRVLPSRVLAESALAFVKEYLPDGSVHAEIADAPGGGHRLVLRGPASTIEDARDQAARWKRSVTEMFSEVPDRFDLEFPGGTLTQFIDEVKQASGFANILIDGDAGSLLVPAISLRGVSLNTIMDNLEVTRVADPDGSTRPRHLDVLEIETIEPVPGGQGQLRSRVAVYRAFERTPPAAASKVQEVRVYRWNVQDRPIKDKGRTEDEVRSAIDLACSMAGFGGADMIEKLKLAIHLPSGLLIVSAPKDMLPIADTVIRAGFATPVPGTETPANATPDAR